MKRIIFTLLSSVLLFQASVAQKVSYSPADSCTKGEKIAHKAIQIGTGAVLTVGITQILKASVSEMRPDRSSTNSFPSRHASWAYAGASAISNELYWHSPWWVLGSHAIATGIGFQRVISERHYPGDVLTGAAIGLGSMQLGYWIGDLIYPKLHRSLPYAQNEQSASLALITEAVIPLSHPYHDVHFRTGLGTRLSATLPFSENWSVQGHLHLQSTPLMMRKRCYDMLNSFGISLGAEWRTQLTQRWACDARASIGAMRNLKTHYNYISAGSFRTDIAIGAGYRLTPALTIGAQLGYQLQTYSNACSALDIGFSTKANF